MWLNLSQHKLFHKVFLSFKPVYTNPMENPYKVVPYLSFIFNHGSSKWDDETTYSLRKAIPLDCQ